MKGKPKTLYIGMVDDLETECILPVSIALTKKRAGELAELWVEEEGLEERHVVKGVWTTLASTYIEL